METVANTPHFEAAPLTFSVWQELWDGNIQDHPDQGVCIAVKAEVNNKPTTQIGRAHV